MLIFLWHSDGSAFTIRRDADFDINEWYNRYADSFKLIGVTHIEYEII